MTEEKSPLDQLLDLVVYAPLGFALSAREVVPQLVARGREGAGGQMAVARMLGQFALAQGQREAEKQVRQARRNAQETLAGLGLTPDGSTAGPSAPPTPPAPGPVIDIAEAAPVPAPATANGRVPSGGRSKVSHLAIPGYDALSASQVVQRLPGLAPAELDAVEAYEAATRHRKTILSKVAQLRAAGSG